MNAAALKVYEAIRAEGTQKSVLPLMQTRDDLYRYLGYHAYEQKLDELFAKRQEDGVDIPCFRFVSLMFPGG